MESSKQPKLVEWQDTAIVGKIGQIAKVSGRAKVGRSWQHAVINSRVSLVKHGTVGRTQQNWQSWPNTVESAKWAKHNKVSGSRQTRQSWPDMVESSELAKHGGVGRVVQTRQN